MAGEERSIPSGLLGQLPAYARDPLGSLRRWSAHRPATALRFGPLRVLLFNRPAGIEGVLDRQATSFRKAPNVRRLASPVIGGSVFTSEGEDWERQRGLLDAPLRPSAVARHEGVVLELAASWNRNRRPGEEIDLAAEMMDLCMRVAGRALFGTSFTDAEVEAVGTALEVTSADFQQRLDDPFLFALPRWLPIGRNRRFADAVARLDEVARRLIAEARGRAPDPTSETLLDQLVHGQAAHPWLTDELIRDNVVMLLVESREDPALLVSWALFLLARHPDHQRRLRAELAATPVAPRTGGHLARLPFLAAVIAESLRLYPVAYGLGRQARAETTVDGVSVPRGTLALVSQWSSHRDPDNFPDPDAFRPERWQGRETRDPPGYFPFGLGPRRCLGEPLTRLEAPLLLASLLRAWRFRLASEEAIEPRVQLSLRPARPIRMRLEPVALSRCSGGRR